MPRASSALLYQSSRWFSVKHQLPDWTDGLGRLGDSIIFIVVLRTRASNLEERLAKGPYQEEHPAGSEARTRNP